MRSLFLVFAALLAAYQSQAQRLAISPFIDTAQAPIREAVQFLQTYTGAFQNGKTPDFSQYFTPAQCRSALIPDPLLHAIASDGNTYLMADLATIFYAKPSGKYVHLKTLLAWQTNEVLTPFALVNHYVYADSGRQRFHTETEHHADRYRTVVNGPIYYTFPETIAFNKNRSDSLLQRMRSFENEWGFPATKPFRYFYAATAAELARMKGLDYVVGSDENNPSGYADDESRIIYCQGLGEAYFHEVLHLYLNPVYGHSPINHGLIYYLGGSLGVPFKDQLARLRTYLLAHPDVNLSQYDQVLSDDKFLHIDHVVNGLLCAQVFRKEGVTGVKRLLRYPDLESLFRHEYGLERPDWDAYLRALLHS
ncbi:MAG: hypothetical protein EOP52_04995 [Sphingobacteriales bacterium]|nr:MAG: hypothetical protein EOP52_04995 [Sphingobacteriales bacterium]